MSMVELTGKTRTIDACFLDGMHTRSSVFVLNSFENVQHQWTNVLPLRFTAPFCSIEYHLLTLSRKILSNFTKCRNRIWNHIFGAYIYRVLKHLNRYEELKKSHQKVGAIPGTIYFCAYIHSIIEVVANELTRHKELKKSYQNVGAIPWNYIFQCMYSQIIEVLSNQLDHHEQMKTDFNSEDF